MVGVGWMRDGVRGMGAWWARYRYAREPSAVTNTITITNTNPIMGIPRYRSARELFALPSALSSASLRSSSCFLSASRSAQRMSCFSCE